MPDSTPFEKSELAWTLPWDDDWVTAVCIAGPTRKLAAGNNRGQILLWELPDKPGGAAPAPIRRLDGHTNVITRLLATPDGRWLVSASFDHSIRVWDLQAAAGAESTAIVLNARAREEAERRKSSKVPAPLEAKVTAHPPGRVLEGHR